MPVHAAKDLWVLETATTAYALGLDRDGRLVHYYWGSRLPRMEDYQNQSYPYEFGSFNMPENVAREEYPAYAGARYIEPCLKASFADGVRDVVLEFVSAEVSADAQYLQVHLRDRFYPLALTLHYRLQPAYDLIERWVEITNQGDSTIMLERAFSAQWHLPPGDDYRLTHLHGKYFDEMQVIREPLKSGIKVLESRRITTSHSHNPWFAVDRINASGATANEHTGKVWFGALAWSGNWKLSAEVTEFAQTRISLGLNDWDFAWRLNPGETFETPACVGGYTEGGFGSASRHMHDYIREQVLPHGSTPHKVLYNSWEVTEFNVSEDQQIELAELAAEMGVELFVMDDGWFHGRNHDRAGLGDWWPDETKFPQGLKSLIQHVNKLGMDFGLWVEPEMVNPDSDLYRAHPDWVIHFPNRERTTARNQLILNFGREDVQEYIIAQLDRLLTENKIAFVKWDMNRNVSEPGWPDAPGDPREIWVRYVQGLYRVWGTLQQRHPDLIWQSCSGGGGRADLGILRLADQIWLSDNTEPSARLGMHEGFSFVFPANTMEAWVTDMGPAHLSLEFRMHVSMCGSLGIGGHLKRWGAEKRAEAARWIEVYKHIRPIVQFGDQYRLRSPNDAPFSAVQYMSKDRTEGVLFAFRTHMPEPVFLPPVYPKGLDPDSLYQVEGYSDLRSGKAWMEAGLRLELKDFQSSLRRIRKISD